MCVEYYSFYSNRKGEKSLLILKKKRRDQNEPKLINVVTHEGEADGRIEN